MHKHIFIKLIMNIYIYTYMHIYIIRELIVDRQWISQIFLPTSLSMTFEAEMDLFLDRNDHLSNALVHFGRNRCIFGQKSNKCRYRNQCIPRQRTPHFRSPVYKATKWQQPHFRVWCLSLQKSIHSAAGINASNHRNHIQQQKSPHFHSPAYKKATPPIQHPQF